MLLAVGLAAAACSAVLSEPASAGTVGVTGTIQGAGSMTSVEGGPYSCSKTNNYNDDASSSCDRQAFEAAFESWVWLRPEPADFPSGNSDWRFGSWQNCDETRVRDGVTECAVHSGSFTLDEKTPKAYFYDYRSPDVRIDGGPTNGSRVSSTSATLTFSSTDTLANFRCRFDSELTYSSCSSGLQKSNLSQGSHTFRVHAIDPSGNASLDATRTWTVDTIAPTASISNGPQDGSVTASRSAMFTFGAGEGSRFFCKLDGGSFAQCAGPSAMGGTSPNYTNLQDGSHTFSVYADDGLQSGATATRTWTVDGTPPDTTIQGPARTKSRRPEFRLGATEPDPTFECSIDGAAFTACSSPYRTPRLKLGMHMLRVQASDQVGNTDPLPAEHSFKVKRRRR